MLGKKLGMTQVFDEDGAQVPVTVIQAGPCVAVQEKTVERDGYRALQVGFGDQKESRLSKPLRGHYAKAQVSAKRMLREVPLGEGEDVAAGAEITVEIFEGCTHVDVIGVTKGRGTQGVMRRHGMAGGRATHGSTSKRRPGSIGQCEFPARVFKGKRMAGHMGATRVTTQNLKLIQVRAQDHVLLVRGSVPGPAGATVLVRKAMKKAAKAS